MGTSASCEAAPFAMWELRVVKRIYVVWQTKLAMRFGLSRRDVFDLMEGAKGAEGADGAAFLWAALSMPESEASMAGTPDSMATPVTELSTAAAASPGRRRKAPTQIDALGMFALLAIYANASFDDKLRTVFSFFDFDNDDRLATDEFAILALSTVCALRATMRRVEGLAKAVGRAAAAATRAGELAKEDGSATSPLFTATPVAKAAPVVRLLPSTARPSIRSVRRQCEKFVAGAEFGVTSNASTAVSGQSIKWATFRQYIKTELDHDNDATAESLLAFFETPDAGNLNDSLLTGDADSVASFGSGGGYRATVHRPETWLDSVMRRRFRVYETPAALTALQFAQLSAEAAAEGHSGPGDGRRVPARFVPWEGDQLIKGAAGGAQARSTSILDAMSMLALDDELPSIEPPLGSVALEWVHGTTGAARDSVHCLASGEVLFPAGAVIVVFDMQLRSQRFFRGHSDAVTSIALHPLNRMVVASGQAVLRRRRRDRHDVALPNHTAAIVVWDAATLAPSALLDAPEVCERIAALAWGPEGEMLLAVGADIYHTAFLFRLPAEAERRDHYTGEQRVVRERTGRPPKRVAPIAMIALGLPQVMSVAFLGGGHRCVRLFVLRHAPLARILSLSISFHLSLSLSQWGARGVGRGGEA